MFIKGNIYYTSVYVNGKQRQVSLGTKNKAEAKKLEQKVLKEHGEKRLSEIMEQWFYYIRKNSDRYKSDSRKDIKIFIDQFLKADQNAELITRDTLIDYLDWMIEVKWYINIINSCSNTITIIKLSLFNKIFMTILRKPASFISI